MINWLNDNKEWVFSGIGILAISSVFAIIKLIFKKKNNECNSKIQKQKGGKCSINIQGGDNSTNTQIDKVYINMKNSSKIILQFKNNKCKLYYPEVYLENNSHDNIINYNSIQQLVNEFDVMVVNTGMDFFKNIKIICRLDKEETTVTDKNLLWLCTSLPIESFNQKNDDKYYIQEIEISTIRPNEELRLPLNARMNGFIVSSIFNISHFISLNKDDFKSTQDSYLRKCNKKPLKVPKLFIDLEYEDLDNAIHREKLCFEFIIEYQSLCSHFSIIIKEVFYK